MTRWQRAAAVLVVVLSPVLGFELLYLYGIHAEALPPTFPATAIPTPIQRALWVGFGETPGDGIERLWVGNYFRVSGASGGFRRRW